MADGLTTFNLKLPRDVRKKFKTVTRRNGTTMQAVLAAFVDSYVDRPKNFKIKMEISKMDKLEGIGETDISMQPGGIMRYGLKKLGNFVVRGVFVDGKPTGEYHIKPVGGLRKEVIVGEFKSRVTQGDVGVVDPDEVLGLEYPIFLKVNDPMEIEGIEETFDQANTAINEQLKPTGGNDGQQK